MTAGTNAFDEKLLSYSPKFLMKATDLYVADLTRSGAAIAALDNGDAPGGMLVPSNGLIGDRSFRLTGNVARTLKCTMLNSHKLTTLSLLLVISNLRGTPGTPTSPQPFTTVVDSNLGPFDLYDGSGGVLRIRFNIGGSYLYASIDKTKLSPSGSIVHITFDGRYASTVVDGVVITTSDFGKSGTITYTSGYTISIGGVAPNNNAGDFDIAYLGIFDVLSSIDVTAQVEAYKTVGSLSGTAILDNGQPASSVMISDWDGARNCVVTPAGSGAWEASVPPGDYLVTGIGPSGYRPISHGPVTAVDP